MNQTENVIGIVIRSAPRFPDYDKDFFFMIKEKSVITKWLENSPNWLFTFYAILVSFSTYFCMYAFRKPFAVAGYEDQTYTLFDLKIKTVFVISQIIGYTLSKYVGIKICSEIQRSNRAFALFFLIIWAELALFLFAMVPPSLKIAFIFLNGFPLGMVWGMVVSYLEGRCTSELLLAGLSCSFIVSSGTVKDVGKLLMNQYGITEYWMPALVGLLFLPLYMLSVWLLNQIPPPTQADEAARVEREPMDASMRYAFVKQFLFGLVMLLITYFFLTAYRDFRDNYGIEIIRELGYADKTAVFTRTELPIAIGVMVVLAALNLIKNNRLGLIGAYAIMAGGTVLMGASTLLFDAGRISGLWWMGLVGLGSYLAYVPYGSVLFDRTIAATRVAGTAVFAIYIADAVGYSGSVGVQLYKDLGQSALSRFAFFREYTYFTSILGTILLAGSCIYFLRKSRPAL